MKKFIILAVFICAFAVMTSCKKKKGGGEEINMNIDLNTKPELNILMPYSGYTISEVNEDSNAKLLEKLTGYKVKYTQLPAAEATKVLNTEMLDRKAYDAMKLTKDQFADLVKNDMLVDITDALKKFAPDLLNCISKESWDVVTVNGKIYGIPERASSDNIENPIIFNQDLLFECNLDIPTTLAEFEEVLRVLSAKIGKPALTFDKFTPLIYAISAAFGIYSEWQEYEVNGTKQVLYYMNAPRYKDYVDYMHNLYQKKYIDISVATNTAADALNRFTSGNAASIACSLWSVNSIVSGLEASGKISSTEAASTLDNYLGYLRALKEKASDQEKVYRASGYAYITAIPFYQAENAGYALDWINSKVVDNDTKHNFRELVLGEEGVHWTYSQKEGYLPIASRFGEKNTASYYLTGTNEKVYTEYWLARVRKSPELYRAWSTLMKNADSVGAYNLVDFAPVIQDYNKNRAACEEYAQDQFYIMLTEGSTKLSEYQTKLNGQHGCTTAENAVNNWYKNYKK